MNPGFRFAACLITSLISTAPSALADAFSELDFRPIESVEADSFQVCADSRLADSEIPSVLYWLTPLRLLPVRRRGAQNAASPAKRPGCNRLIEYGWPSDRPASLAQPTPGVLFGSKTPPTRILQPPAPRMAPSQWMRQIAAKTHEGEKFTLSKKDGKIRPAGKAASPCATRVWQEFTWLICEDAIHLFHRGDRVTLSNTGSPSSDISDEAPRIRILLTFQIGPQKYYVIERRTATGDDFTVPVSLLKRTAGQWQTRTLMEHFEAEN